MFYVLFYLKMDHNAWDGRAALRPRTGDESLEFCDIVRSSLVVSVSGS